MQPPKLPDHIKEYLNTSSKKSDFTDLFESNRDDFDLKTELNKNEIVVSNVIMLNDLFLKSKGIEDNIYGFFVEEYLRLRVSLDRKSRIEFVNINKKDKFEDNLNAFGSFSNLKKIKE